MSMARLVDPPSLRTNPHGLVESGNLVIDLSGKWEAGVTFTPDGCYIVNFDPVACPPIDQIAVEECIDPAVFMPWLLYLNFKWSTADRGYDVKERAAMHLDVGTSSKLEALTATGGAGGTNPIFDTAPTVLSDADPAVVMGRVEAMLLDRGSPGTIHMSSVSAASIGYVGLTEENGNLYTIGAHSKVIVGAYPQDTIYGHVGDIDVYLGDISVIEAPDAMRETNEQVIQAQRLALAVWNPCSVFKGVVAAA